MKFVILHDLRYFLKIFLTEGSLQLLFVSGGDLIVSLPEIHKALATNQAHNNEMLSYIWTKRVINKI